MGKQKVTHEDYAKEIRRLQDRNGELLLEVEKLRPLKEENQFLVEELRRCREVIDGYNILIHSLKVARKKYVEASKSDE